MYYTAVTLGIFVLILVIIRLKLPLWLGLLIGTVLGGFLFRLNAVDVFKTLFMGAIQVKTVGLVIITLLILTLSNLMNLSGMMERIVKLTGQILRRPGILIAALPALIGLLPMPGGALFSAPMVKTAAKDTQAKAEEMSTINYWYRHIWEHWWPLYPGVMLAVTLTDLPLKKYMLSQFPLTLCMAVSGLLLYRKIHPDVHIKQSDIGTKTKRKFLLAVSPIWILLLVWLPVSFIAPKFLNENSAESVNLAVQRYLPLTLGLIVSILSVIIINKVKMQALFSVISKKATWKLALTVTTVMIFQYLLRQAGAAGEIAEELQAMKVPVVLVVAILPFIAGMVTGLAIGFVGTSFIIIIPLVMAMPGEVSLLPYIALAYGFGHLGMMLSPIHICYVVTTEYFQTGYMTSYKLMWPTFALNLTLVTGYFVILRITI